MEFEIGDLVSPAVDLMAFDTDDLALVVGFDEDGDLLLEFIKATRSYHEGETIACYAGHWKHAKVEQL
jgi:hypothetical protein